MASVDTPNTKKKIFVGCKYRTVFLFIGIICRQIEIIDAENTD